MKGFTKGMITGSLIGGTIGMFMDSSESGSVSKMKKKTVKAMKSIGSAMGDFVSGK